MGRLLSLAELIDPRHVALLVVDVQNDFCHDEGAFGRMGADLSMIQEMVPRLIGLIDEARRKKVPVIFTGSREYPWTWSTAWDQVKLALNAGENPPVVTDWGAAFYEGIEPRPDEPVIMKRRYSAFYGSDLDLILRTLERKTLILTGVASNICVESTARDGFMRDYLIVFVGDCSAATSRWLHEATLENIRLSFGRVVSAEDILSTWASIPGLSPAERRVPVPLTET